MKIAIIGYGGRGAVYTTIFVQLGAEIAAVCDNDPARLAIAKEKYGLAADKLFTNADGFFAKGKLADVCVIATQDASHKTLAVPALEIGYDLVLEKPIATNAEDCKAILDAANRHKQKVYVCHVLRYAPFYTAIKKELDSGAYGRIITINAVENVGYYHQAHSFVRGNWSDTKKSTPMIIAKCCHDLDILSWLIGLPCKTVSSYGSLSYFTRNNAPEGSADRCLDCSIKKNCKYDADAFYTSNLRKGLPQDWVNLITAEPTLENALAALRTGPYGRCVYKCDNDAVDHQVVNMLFDGGVTASLTMTAFSAVINREIHVYCEKGELFGFTDKNLVTCNIFGGASKNIDVSGYVESSGYYGGGHHGGDYLLVEDIVNGFNGKPVGGLTSIQESMRSHFIGFAAESSRLNGGKPIKVVE
jgi:predicted dehydrogenase